MGTRSTTKIYENGELVLALCKQHDGYADSWGKELKDFLKSGKFVNGFSLNSDVLQFNGIGDFALLLVKNFKERTGELYATTEEDTQEYNYLIKATHLHEKEKTEIEISCLEDETFKEIFII